MAATRVRDGQRKFAGQGGTDAAHRRRGEALAVARPKRQAGDRLKPQARRGGGAGIGSLSASLGGAIDFAGLVLAADRPRELEALGERTRTFRVDQRHGRSGIGGVGLARDVGRNGRGSRAVGADHDVAVESVESRVGAPLDPARELWLDQRQKLYRPRDPQGARPHSGAGTLHIDPADFGHEGRIVGEAAGGPDEGIVEFTDKSRQSAGQRRSHA